MYKLFENLIVIFSELFNSIAKLIKFRQDIPYTPLDTPRLSFETSSFDL